MSCRSQYADWRDNPLLEGRSGVLGAVSISITEVSTELVVLKGLN